MRERTDCRLCGGSVSHVFSLKPAPIANSFPTEPDSQAKKYPLDLMQCSDCGHVQQRYVFDSLFEDYKYRTPARASELWAPLADRIADEFHEGRVLEIGCNNGVFLDLLLQRNVEAWGCDPASTHSQAVKEFFTPDVANALGRFNCIVGLNCFAHIDDLDSVFNGIAICLEPDGKLIFEVQYLVDMLESGAFDMIYHEHCDYHHVAPLARFLKKHGLFIAQLEHIPQHGGSIRITAQKNYGLSTFPDGWWVSDTAGNTTWTLAAAGGQCELPDEHVDFELFGDKIAAARERLHERISGKVQAFGAAAKASTLINQFELHDKIECVLDDTPENQGRFIPGTDIRIWPVYTLHEGPVLLTAWNYADVIAKRIPNELIHPFR